MLHYLQHYNTTMCLLYFHYHNFDSSMYVQESHLHLTLAYYFHLQGNMIYLNHPKITWRHSHLMVELGKPLNHLLNIQHRKLESDSLHQYTIPRNSNHLHHPNWHENQLHLFHPKKWLLHKEPFLLAEELHRMLEHDLLYLICYHTHPLHLDSQYLAKYYNSQPEWTRH